eukprot:Tbor_TRINITY_DN5225_c0_g4::TRINITY_DN5225_c0_g4_i1::g.16328::m.16328
MLLLNILLCSILVISGATSKKEVYVLTLTDDNFKSKIAKIPVVMVKFYAPGIGQDDPSSYEQSARELAKDGNPDVASVRFAVMNIDEEKRTIERIHGVKFPLIKVYRFGEYIEEFPAKDRPVAEYMRRMALAVVNRKVTTLEEMQKITGMNTANNTAVVGYFRNTNAVDYKIFSTVASLVSSLGISTYYTTNQDILSSFGFFSNRPAVIMYRPNMEPFKVVYRGTIFKVQLKEWIMNNIVPIIGGTYTAANRPVFKASPNSYVLFVNNKDDSTMDLMKELHKDYPNVTFAYSHINDVSEHGVACGDTSVDVCSFIIAVAGNDIPNVYHGKTFTNKGNISKEITKNFIRDFLAGNITIKKESKTTDDVVAGKVATVVTSNFKSLIQSSKAVFVKFYAPWCSHCKDLAPKFEELALEMKNMYDDIMIAKYDATENTLPEEFVNIYKTTGYPTIFFVPYGGSDKPVIYHGSREVADMKKWIEEKLS